MSNPADERTLRSAVTRLGNLSLAGFALAVGLMALVFALPYSPLTLVLALGVPVCAISAMVCGVRALHGKTPSMRLGVMWQASVVVFGIVGGVLAMLYGALVALFTVGGGRGRQIRSFGRALLAPVVPGSAWTQDDIALGSCAELDDSTRQALARQWRENGRTEHASVAAFAELTRELMVLGAPPALLASAQRDALDEIRHTELCFALARALDGKEEGPGPLEAAGRNLSGHLGSRTAALASLAVSSLIDGVLHEGLSARVLARLARRCQDAEVAAMVKTIAADEGRHAAHGWDVVRWCVAEGGVPVVHALRGAAKIVADQAASAQSEGAKDGSWERHGIHGDALHDEEYAKAVADLRRRVANLWTVTAPDVSRHTHQAEP